MELGEQLLGGSGGGLAGFGRDGEVAEEKVAGPGEVLAGGEEGLGSEEIAEAAAGMQPLGGGEDGAGPAQVLEAGEIGGVIGAVEGGGGIHLPGAAEGCGGAGVVGAEVEGAAEGEHAAGISGMGLGGGAVLGEGALGMTGSEEDFGAGEVAVDRIEASEQIGVLEGVLAAAAEGGREGKIELNPAPLNITQGGIEPGGFFELILDAVKSEQGAELIETFGVASESFETIQVTGGASGVEPDSFSGELAGGFEIAEQDLEVAEIGEQRGIFIVAGITGEGLEQGAGLLEAAPFDQIVSVLERRLRRGRDWECGGGGQGQAGGQEHGCCPEQPKSQSISHAHLG